MGTILEASVINADDTSEDVTYLIKENYLSEFETEDEKSVARANLGVYAADSVYTKSEAKSMVNKKIKAALADYVTVDELPQAIAALSEEIAEAGYVKSDGSVPFTNAQTQSALPTQNYHLANKIYVDNLLKSHVNATDPHDILSKVEVLLADYAKLSDTYTTANSYSKKDVDNLLRNVIRRDGSVPFTRPQIGIDPLVPSHLATARYTKLVMEDHKSELDPHGFRKALKTALSNYYTKSETYTKAQTYSRSQLLDIIKSQMRDIVNQAIATHVAEDGSVSELQTFILNKLYDCIKADGSVSHTAPQAGVAAVQSNQFVILQQLTTAIEDLKETLTDAITDATNQTTWITSGPVKSTVGFVEDETRLPKEMTVQQICDAIFYGSEIGLKAPAYATYGTVVCLQILVYGLSTLTEVDIYKNDELIATLTAEDFAANSDGNGSYYEYCDSDAFTEDTEWKVVFTYSDGQEIVDTATTKLAYPIFIGAIPYWWNAEEDITMDSLATLAEEDSENCAFYTKYGPEISKLSVKFDFSDVDQRSIAVILPSAYPDLLRMVTPAQDISVSAFSKTVQPMYPNNVTTGVNYKIYIFNQPLVTLNQVVKFYFGKATEEDDDE